MPPPTNLRHARRHRGPLRCPCGTAPALRRRPPEPHLDQFRDASREIAAGLAALGIRKSDVVAIASETRAELYLADFGIMALGAVPPPSTPPTRPPTLSVRSAPAAPGSSSPKTRKC